MNVKEIWDVKWMESVLKYLGKLLHIWLGKYLFELDEVLVGSLQSTVGSQQSAIFSWQSSPLQASSLEDSESCSSCHFDPSTAGEKSRSNGGYLN